MIYDYLGPLGSAQTPCLTLGIEGYVIRTDKLASQLKMPQDALRNYSYYLLKLAAGFRAADLSDKHDIDFGVKRSQLKIELKRGTAKEAFPTDERKIKKDRVEYEWGVTIAPEGALNFKVFEGGLKSEVKYRRLVKTEIEKINTYTYFVGRSGHTPEWVFELREGQSHLEGEKYLQLVVESPKRKGISGNAVLVPRDLVLLDADHNELSLGRRIFNKLTGQVLNDEHFIPAETSFSTRIERPPVPSIIAATLTGVMVGMGLSWNTIKRINSILDDAKSQGLI